MTALPHIYGITAASLCGSLSDFLARLDKALASGRLRLLQVRDKQLGKAERAAYARECVARCKAHACKVLINDDAELAAKLGADGTHVSSASLTTRPGPRPGGLVGFSAHNKRELELGFERLEADFAVLSPVLATLTHVDAKPLGWAGFSELAGTYPKPVFALGGVRLSQLALARRHRAAGVASMRSLWALPMRPAPDRSGEC